MKHSIRFRLTAITVILMSISFVLLWIINNCFLEQFYYENKVNQMIECYAVIQYCATTDSLTKDEIKNQIQQMKDRYNLSLLYMDEDWEYINEFASLVESLLLAERLKEFVMNPDRRNMNLLYSSSDMWICETKETLTQTSYLYGWGIAGNTTMFIMRTPLESIAESTRIAISS